MSGPSAGGGVAKLLGASAGLKVLVMGTSGAMSVVTTSLVIHHFGVDAYAQFGLLAAMAALLPFADLGLSAAVMNTVSASADPTRDPKVRGTLLSAIRLLIVSGAAILAVGLLISGLGLWDALLGAGLDPNGGSLAAFACLAVFCLTLPFGVGQRVLTGLHKNHVQVGLQALAAPFLLLLVLGAVLLGASSNVLPVFSYLATTLVAVACFLVAMRLLGPQLRGVLRDVPKLRTVRGHRVSDVAWPMLVQLLALPIALQTDRLLLSHLAGPHELAQYNLGSQMFGLIVQLINTTGIALWPVFAGARARGEIRSPYPATLAFLGVGVGLATVLALLLPVITPILAGNALRLDGWLVVGFVAFIATQAAKYPLGMYMTSPEGLRFQTLPIVILAPLNLGISWALIAPLGAAGPILGSAISVTLCQVIPNYFYVRRDLRRRRAARRDAVTADLVLATDYPT